LRLARLPHKPTACYHRFQIIEEDFIFPISALPVPVPEISVTRSPTHPRQGSQETLSSSSSGSGETISEEQTNTKKRSRLASFRSAGSSGKALEAKRSRARASSSATILSESIALSNHPQNHTKLRIAWESMLTNRFISNKVLSILPFYLSTIFSGVEAFDLYSVPLPSNTPLNCEAGGEDDSLYSAPRFNNTKNNPKPVYEVNANNPMDFPIQTNLPRLQAMNSQELAGMHLHYTVGFIKSCKDAIRREYQRLFPHPEGSRPSEKAQIPPGNDALDLPCAETKPDRFEVEWNDWVW
jgi:hypothetical protein